MKRNSLPSVLAVGAVAIMVGWIISLSFLHAALQSSEARVQRLEEELQDAMIEPQAVRGVQDQLRRSEAACQFLIQEEAQPPDQMRAKDASLDDLREALRRTQAELDELDKKIKSREREKNRIQ